MRSSATQNSILMSIITCNVRGTNQVYKHKEMKAFCRENNFILLAILENKVKEERAPKIIKNLRDKWRWAANYNIDRRGRIWVLRDYSIIDFRVDVVHQQFIFGYCTRIKSNTGFYFRSSVWVTEN